MPQRKSSSPKGKKPTGVQLPDDILAHIFSSLTSEHRARAACVCKQWRAASFIGAALFSVGQDFVAPLDFTLIETVSLWFHRYGRGLRAIRLKRSLQWGAYFSKEIFKSLSAECSQLRILELTSYQANEFSFAQLVNLVSCSVVLSQQLPPNYVWPFAVLSKLEHLMITSNHAYVLVGGLPQTLKTFSCCCTRVFWKEDQPAPQLEVLTLDQTATWGVNPDHGYKEYSDQAREVTSLLLKVKTSRTLGSHGQLKALVRLILINTDGLSGQIDLSAVASLQDAILLGSFKVLGLPARLLRLALACDKLPMDVPNLLTCPQLKLVSLSGIAARVKVAAPPGCVVVKGREALFMGGDKRRVLGRSIKMAPFEALLGDLDIRPCIEDAWEALWQV